MPTHRSIRYSALLGLAGALCALLVAPATGHAQATTCLPTALVQRDMAGVWTGLDGPFQLTVYPCGGTALLWRNENGVNGAAAYNASSRLAGGGYTATVYVADPVIGTPWNTRTVTYKPNGVAGQIQVIFWAAGTVSPLKVYSAVRTAASSSVSPV